MAIDFASLLGLKSRPLVGVDISASSVKMVELSVTGKKSERRYHIDRYAIEYLPKGAVSDGQINNPTEISDTLRRCWTRLGTSTRNVALALPISAVITRKITLPSGLSEQAMEQLVTTEANQFIPFAIEEVNLDFDVIGPGSGSEESEVVLAAARKDKIDDRVACAEAAGLKPVVVDIDTFAMQAAIGLVAEQLPGEGRGQMIAVVDVGAYSMSVNILQNGESVYSREQLFGGSQLTEDIMRAYNMGYDEAEVAKRAGNLPSEFERGILAPFLENLSLELANVFQFFISSTPYHGVNCIVLAGGCATLPGIVEAVSARNQVPAIIANPFSDMTSSRRIRPAQLEADAPMLLVACGLAMRRFDK